MADNGLIFDVDGVLADTETLIARATMAMFREDYGVELRPEDFVPFIGTGAVRYTQGPAEVRGIEINLESALEHRHQNFKALLDAGECKAFPGALELVSAAAEAGWALGIATSSPTEKAKATWAAIDLPLERFGALITGDMVTHKKPHPEIYEAACAELHLPPDRCVVVEDAVAGVEAAKTAGAACIAVTTSFTAEQLSQADLVVDTLEDVTPGVLAELLK